MGVLSSAIGLVADKCETLIFINTNHTWVKPLIDSRVLRESGYIYGSYVAMDRLIFESIADGKEGEVIELEMHLSLNGD